MLDWCKQAGREPQDGTCHYTKMLAEELRNTARKPVAVIGPAQPTPLVDSGWSANCMTKAREELFEKTADAVDLIPIGSDCLRRQV